jgi:hypothetical protein
MARGLQAAGYFKRMSGSWLPETDRFLYEKNDKIFVKRAEWPAYEQVGGGEPGSAPEESARILFWNGVCRLCDINLVSVQVRTGMANTGKLVLTMSRDDQFQEGWFVAVESIVSQVTVPLLTRMQDGRRHVSYRDGRQFTLRFDAPPIAEDDTFIRWKMPSVNAIGVSEESWQDHSYVGENAFDLINLLSYTYYYNYGNANGKWATEQQLPVGSEPRQFTARLHKITCGTVSEGSRNTISSQSVWTGIISDIYPPSADLWIGLGDNFVRAGLNRHVFLPPMPLTHLQRDRLQPPNRFWKVDAIPGEILTVKNQWGAVRSRSTAGIAAIGAVGTLVLGTRVTESPKARTQRASLVTSAQGLIWSDGVLPGINADHRKKAARTPETVFPFDQPQQSRAISVGAAKAVPASLTATFTSTATKEDINFTSGASSSTAIEMSNDLLKPRVRVRQHIVADETGRIGRNFTGWAGFVGANAAEEYVQVPQKEPWVGLLDNDLEIMRTKPFPESIIAGAGFWYGGSNQTRQWATFKTNDYTLDVESLKDLPYAVSDGTYVGTNVMPDGSPSSFDLFYAAPELGEIASVPTLSEPVVLNPDLPTYAHYYASSLLRPPGGWGDFYVDPVFAWANNLPFLHAKTEVFGELLRGSGFGGPVFIAIDPDHHDFEYRVDGYSYLSGRAVADVAGWAYKATSSTNTATKLSAQATFVAERVLKQTFEAAQAANNTHPRSEFYKADPSQFDDYMSRLCEAARVTVVKSCRWIPKQTQMFMSIDRGAYVIGNGIPGGWGNYTGTVPDEDKLEMLDQYRQALPTRSESEPTGGSIDVFLRRTWQIEATVATGSPTYIPLEVISDELQTSTSYTDTRYGGNVYATTSFVGTRTAKCGVEFDIEDAETITHAMSHEQLWVRRFSFTELEWERLEAGDPVEKSVDDRSSGRFVPTYTGDTSASVRTSMKVVFQFT